MLFATSTGLDPTIIDPHAFDPDAWGAQSPYDTQPAVASEWGTNIDQSGLLTPGGVPMIDPVPKPPTPIVGPPPAGPAAVPVPPPMPMPMVAISTGMPWWLPIGGLAAVAGVVGLLVWRSHR